MIRWGVGLLVLAAVGPAYGQDGAAASGEDRTRVVLLGTGTPNADPERWGPAVAVVVDGRSYIVDCGPGVVRRAAAARALHGVDALAPENLERVFITHLHSDHTLGCPDLLLSPWVLDRDRPLMVWGPPGTADMMASIQAAYREDIRMRVDGLEPRDDRGWRVDVDEIRAGVIYRDDRVTVTAFPVDHGSWEHAYGFRFETSDRTVVISGDTRPVDAVVAACDGCDVLVHEVYSATTFQGRSPEWQRYHAAFHTSTVELARLAARARPELLVLYHQLYWGATDADLVAELREAGYEGRVVSGEDLAVY